MLIVIVSAGSEGLSQHGSAYGLLVKCPYRLMCLNIRSPVWKVVEPLEDEVELEKVWGLTVIALVGSSRALYSVSSSTQCQAPAATALNALAALAAAPLPAVMNLFYSDFILNISGVDITFKLGIT